VRIIEMMMGWRILKVALSLPTLLGFLLVAPGADASPRNPEVFGRRHKLHSPINETTANLIRGFIDHVSAVGGAADPTYVSSYPSFVPLF
jgi:hypothetical protein